ncbi:MAG: hypothetical protein PUP93_27215 [Rhizonema sp. NSF051]|nr:hypothetical protein [Rhizonema sp. NSF051]
MMVANTDMLVACRSEAVLKTFLKFQSQKISHISKKSVVYLHKIKKTIALRPKSKRSP